jgi:hypothetical protein
MQTTSSVSTLTTLANANDLVAAIVMSVVGNDVADTINDSPLTKEVIFAMTQTHIQKDLSTVLGAF